MRKNEFNVLFREHVKNNLSPTVTERNFVSAVYGAFQELLGESNCLQIGSYPRFTSITPLHDLDVLYILGNREPSNPDPAIALNDLEKRIRDGYQNPTEYTIKISRQTHSITVLFLEGEEEIFSVDVVPAYISGTNEFGDDTYIVPEILSKNHTQRQHVYVEVAKGSRKMTWIRSDPRGYIAVATEVNQANNDFRKSVKFVKAWRASCKELDDDLPIKSFHIEQVITEYFRRDTTLEIYDAIFRFFCDIPKLLERSQIADRADPSEHIDDYIDSLTDREKKKIVQARDHFLIKLENFADGGTVADLVEGGFHDRASSVEAYLFDSKIPVFIEEDLKIIGKLLVREGSFRQRFLDAIGLIEIDRKIEFRTTGNIPVADLFKWKVKNDDDCSQPRGEITDHRTLRDPEHTQYKGKHYVECYAIRDGVCVARVRQNVVLN